MTSSIQLLLVAVIVTLTLILIVMAVQVMTILFEVRELIKSGRPLPEQIKKPLQEFKESLSSPRRFFKGTIKN